MQRRFIEVLLLEVGIVVLIWLSYILLTLDAPHVASAYLSVTSSTTVTLKPTPSPTATSTPSKRNTTPKGKNTANTGADGIHLALWAVRRRVRVRVFVREGLSGKEFKIVKWGYEAPLHA